MWSHLTGCATRRLETAGRNQLGLSWGCRLQLGYRIAQPVEAEQQEAAPRADISEDSPQDQTTDMAAHGR